LDVTLVKSIPVYDEIGRDYRRTRREDPRLFSQITEALGGAQSVVNVGAGSGSYEPKDRSVVAVEPSIRMIAQRGAESAPVIRAAAEFLPFRDRVFAAAMAVLTIHHWSDPNRGLRELGRVVRERVVILTFDPQSEGFWLTDEYFPEFVQRDRARCLPIDKVTEHLRNAEVFPVPIPHDCVDGFLGAYWRRPEAYLDARVRTGISSFAQCADLSPLTRLGHDLETGRWHARHGSLLDRTELDIGYRLVVGQP
jgi:SAM-dependent methyltransferase